MPTIDDDAGQYDDISLRFFYSERPEGSYLDVKLKVYIYEQGLTIPKAVQQKMEENLQQDSY